MKDFEMILQDARMEGREEALRIIPVLLQAKVGDITMTDVYDNLIAAGFSKEIIDETNELLIKCLDEEKKQKVLEEHAKSTALRLIRASMDPSATQASIKEWFGVELSDPSIKYLVGQLEIEENFAKAADAIEGRPGNVKSKSI
ncbi:hypothetical protein [Hominisplanchenecus sp.]|uniref:hypothetical protein n=1 Tax=Hominisplanchenecus sp. TaxID=3038130 RepID=UPI003995B2B8